MPVANKVAAPAAKKATKKVVKKVAVKKVAKVAAVKRVPRRLAQVAEILRDTVALPKKQAAPAPQPPAPVVLVVEEPKPVVDKWANLKITPADKSPINRTLYNGYDIFDPRDVKFVERTDFLKNIVGHIDAGDKIEDVVVKSVSDAVVAVDMREMARTYIKLRNKGARLPKFSRWVTGMFAANEEYAKFLAAEGQKAAAREIHMSVDLIDILRCADTPHFGSCFKRVKESIDRNMVHKYDVWDQYQYMPVLIAEEAPGIGICYVNDEKGKMMGRQWMHHGRLKSTGEDVLVLTTGHYGCLQGENLARLLAARGVKVGYMSYYGERGEPMEFVGCFTKRLHHDLATWEKNARFVQIGA